MTRDEIIQKAFELGTIIAESQEMQNFRKMQAEVILDAEAYTLVVRFQQARDEAAGQLEDEIPLTAEQEAYLEQLEKELQANTRVQELLKAQEVITNLLNAVYFAIDQAVNGVSCGESDCQSCGGGCL